MLYLVLLIIGSLSISRLSRFNKSSKEGTLCLVLLKHSTISLNSTVSFSMWSILKTGPLGMRISNIYTLYSSTTARWLKSLSRLIYEILSKLKSSRWLLLDNNTEGRLSGARMSTWRTWRKLPVKKLYGWKPYSKYLRSYLNSILVPWTLTPNVSIFFISLVALASSWHFMTWLPSASKSISSAI